MSRRDTLRRVTTRVPALRALSTYGEVWLRRVTAAERHLWVLAVSAMCFDVATTVYGLRIGLSEANPIARVALEWLGAAGLYGLKLVALLLGLACWWLIPDRYGGLVPLGLAVPSIGAVIVNATLIGVVVGS